MARQKTEAIKKEITPEIEPKAAGGSGFKPKDTLFDKVKSVIDKKTNNVIEVEVDFRKLHIGGTPIILHKGVELSKVQLSKFDDEAKKYFLQKV